MYKLEAIIRPEKLDDVKEALAAAGLTGLNIVHVTGRGAQKGIVHMGRGGETYTVDMLPKVKIEVVVKEADADRVVKLVCDAAHTWPTPLGSAPGKEVTQQSDNREAGLRSKEFRFFAGYSGYWLLSPGSCRVTQP